MMSFVPSVWPSEATIALPADIKYHGLSNQGATCYLNSVLQVLFMTRDFREAVERSICENPDTEFIDRHLRDLFDGLKERITSTQGITKKLSIDRVWEQKDAAEYYEKILALTSTDASQIFHGQLTNKIVCSKCNTETNTDGSFWHLTLELEDSCSEIYSVVNGVEKYFRDSHFTGENQIYCERCDDKSDATIKCALKHHPEVLMLLLKRFKFNYSYMTYVKNNCGVDVPYTLQIPESQPYELYAVVDHFGDLRSGHYTASVKSQDNERWYNFNDTRVTLMDYQPFQVDDTENLRSAYLLFYRKRKTHAAGSCDQDIKEVSTSGGTSDNSKEQEAVDINGKTLDTQDTQEKWERNNKRKMEEETEETNTGADEQTTDTTHVQPKKKVEEKDDYHGGQDHVRLNRPQESLEGKVTHNTSYVEQICKQEDSKMDVRHDCMDKLGNEEKIVMYENINKNRKTEGDEQSDKKEEIPKYLNREEKIQDDEALEGVKHMNDDDGGKQEVSEESGLQPVTMDEKEDEGKMEVDVTDDKRGKTEADKLRSDHYGHEFQASERVGDSEQKISKDNVWCKQGDSSGLHKRHQQQREERKTEQQQHFGQDVDCEIHRVDVRLRPEQISVQQKHFDTEKQVKVRKMSGDTRHIHTLPHSSFRQPGLAAKETVTETQGVDSQDRTRQRNSQSKAGTEFKVVKKKRVKESERNSEIITVDEISQDTTERRADKRKSDKRKSDSKSDEKVTLEKGNEGKRSDGRQDGGRKATHSKIMRGLRNPFTLMRKWSQKNKKQKKTPGCLSVLKRKQKNRKQKNEDSNSE